MAERDRLVRHRDDDAVEVRELLGEMEEASMSAGFTCSGIMIASAPRA